jgi:hypothetical protein
MASEDDSTNPSRDPPADAPEATQQDRSLGHVQRALRNLRFGTVTIIVQDGVVVQIDRTEKTRLR